MSRQTDAVLYVEPSILQQSPSQQSVKTDLPMHDTIPGSNEWMITSRVQALGDFIDTDAVRISYLMISLNILTSV